MAGPGIRYYEMAKTISQKYPVTLAVPNKNLNVSNRNLNIFNFNLHDIEKYYHNCRLVICQGDITRKFPFLLNGPKPLVIDLYDPLHMEILAGSCLGEQKKDIRNLYNRVLDSLHNQLKHGDFFICASERQRDFWMGMLSALNRINPYTFSQDSSLRSLIDVVPFGLPQEPPSYTENVLKGVRPGIKPDDKIILWAGGIWDWLDYETPITAMSKISQFREDIKLFFLGVKRPSPGSGYVTNSAKRAINLSKEMRLINKYVFFNKDWVPYNERQNYLMEADLGLITYNNTLETHFSWRTRILDYIWAGVPVICSNGDSLSQLVAREKLGTVLKKNNIDELVSVILSMINKNTKENIKDNFLHIREKLSWKYALSALLSFCDNPQKAADKI